MHGKKDKKNRVRVILSISKDVLLSYYEGAAQAVVVKSEDGRSIQFPANILRPFVTNNGVHGIFEIEFDENNKFIAIQRSGD